MVRLILITIGIFLMNNYLSAQRLNFNFNGGWMVNKSTSTVFEERAYQILYAAPYTTTSGPFEYSGVENDQVRIARVWGVKPYNNTSFSLGGELTYVFKNNWRIGLNTSFYKDADQLFYSFQNMFVNLDPQDASNNTASPDQLNESIIIHRWMNSFGLRGIYELPIPTLAKIYVSLGYQFRYQMFSYYESELTEKSAENYEGVFLNEYYNISVFQQKLYNDNALTGFNHFIQAGVGMRMYGFAVGFDFNYSPISSNDNYTQQYFINFNFNYDIVSFELFK